jgi:hypothetical protein
MMAENTRIESLGEHRFLLTRSESDEVVEIQIDADPVVVQRIGLDGVDEKRIVRAAADFRWSGRARMNCREDRSRRGRRGLRRFHRRYARTGQPLTRSDGQRVASPKASSDAAGRQLPVMVSREWCHPVDKVPTFCGDAQAPYGIDVAYVGVEMSERQADGDADDEHSHCSGVAPAEQPSGRGPTERMMPTSGMSNDTPPMSATIGTAASVSAMTAALPIQQISPIQYAARGRTGRVASCGCAIPIAHCATPQTSTR